MKLVRVNLAQYGFDFFIYIDTVDGNKIKAQNKTGSVQFSHNTNADSVLQSCINSLSSGGLIRIGSGNFNITTKVSSSNGKITISGSGREATILTRTISSDNDTMNLSGDNINIEHLTFNGNYPTNTTSISSCELVFDGDNTHLFDVQIKNWRNIGVLNTKKTNIDNCVFKGANVLDISLYGARPYTATSNTRITNSVFTDCAYNGIFGSGIMEVIDCYFANNARNSGGQVGSDENGIMSKWIGNTFDAGFSATGVDIGIEIHSGSGEFICIGNKISDQSREGIIIHGPPNAANYPRVIQGNIIKNCGRSGSATGAIVVVSDSTPGVGKNIIITNNICYDDQVSATQDYGIRITDTGSDHYIIRNNLCYGNITANISDLGTGVNKSVGDNVS